MARTTDSGLLFRESKISCWRAYSDKTNKLLERVLTKVAQTETFRLTIVTSKASYKHLQYSTNLFLKAMRVGDMYYKIDIKNNLMEGKGASICHGRC